MVGANQQTVLKFHIILAKPLTRKAYGRFSISEILAAFRDDFLGTYNPMESIIFSTEELYSPRRSK
jgi:hypothetical protein